MATLSMPQVDALRETFPEPAKDTKLNLGGIANSDFLEAEQMWGIALASAYYIGEPRLRDALLQDARAGGVPPELIEDAQAAASLMAMNTVYYRFRHMIGKESYGQKPARLRMQWMVRPKTSKVNFELMSMAVAALAGCEMCVRAHEATLLKHDLSEETVHETVRFAAILNAAAVALRLGTG